jgi:hypothetical protein
MSYFDVQFKAQSVIADWNSDICPPLPKAVADAAEVFEAAEYLEPPWAGVPDTLTAKTVEKTVADMALNLAIAEQFPTAKRRVREDLAGKVLKAADAAVPELLDAMRPGADKAWEAFRVAAEGLPADLKPQTLVDGGSAAVDAYHACHAAQARVDRYATWLGSLYHLDSFSNCRREPLLLLLAPQTRKELQLLVDNSDRKNGINGAFLTAAAEGIEFRLANPYEAVMLAEEIRMQKIVMKQNNFIAGLRAY